MHAPHEPVAPPPDGPPSRRGKVFAMVLASSLMVLATLAIATSRPTAAAAQELPVIATLTGTCVGTDLSFSFTMVNPRSETFNFEYQLAWGDLGLANQFDEDTLEAGETFTHTFDPETEPQPEWRVYISDVDQDYTAVGQSNKVANPCAATTTTTTSATTTATTTTTKTTSSTTTAPTTSTTQTSTTEFTLPTTTTTTNAAVTPAANTGGGLAATGVAVLVLVGGAAVLLFNGIGLTRMSRRGWATKDD